MIGFFAWPYMGRIIRGQTLSLREREFVDAARSLGARGPYILFRELLPNLVGADPRLLHAADPDQHLVRGGAVLPRRRHHPAHAELGRHALGRGRTDYSIDPMYMIIPGLAIFITVMAFNLFGDGLRDALDPKSSR